MIDQYKDSGPKPELKINEEESTKLASQIQNLEAIIRKLDGEMSYLKREVSRLKSDLSQTVNFLRKRG